MFCAVQRDGRRQPQAACINIMFIILLLPSLLRYRRRDPACARSRALPVRPGARGAGGVSPGGVARGAGAAWRAVNFSTPAPLGGDRSGELRLIRRHLRRRLEHFGARLPCPGPIPGHPIPSGARRARGHGAGPIGALASWCAHGCTMVCFASCALARCPTVRSRRANCG